MRAVYIIGQEQRRGASSYTVKKRSGCAALRMCRRSGGRRYMTMRADREYFFHLSEIYSRGITGKGIAAAVLDTGIYEHEDFSRLRESHLLF